jgi:hypothetical protein
VSDALFDLDHPPPIRPGSSDYLAQLAGITYRDDLRPEGWSFWALAPVEKAWVRRYAATLAPVEHVWLTDGRALYQAQVELHSGRILRRRIYKEGLPS